MPMKNNRKIYGGFDRPDNRPRIVCMDSNSTNFGGNGAENMKLIWLRGTTEKIGLIFD